MSEFFFLHFLSWVRFWKAKKRNMNKRKMIIKKLWNYFTKYRRVDSVIARWKIGRWTTYLSQCPCQLTFARKEKLSMTRGSRASMGDMVIKISRCLSMQQEEQLVFMILEALVPPWFPINSELIRIPFPHKLSIKLISLIMTLIIVDLTLSG